MSAPTRRTSEKWLDLRYLVEVVQAQRVTFLAFSVAVVVAALIGSLLSPKEYRAVALIHLMPRAGQEVDVNEVVQYDAANYMEGRERARTQIQIILSRTVREEVVFRYNALGYDDYQTTSADLDRLRGKMSAGPREDTQLVEISVAHADPDRAAILANLVAEVYREGNLEARRDTARETKLWLEDKSGQYRDTVDAASQAVLAFKAEHDVVDIDEKVDGIAQRMSALQKARGEAATQRVLLETSYYEHSRLLRAERYDVLSGMFDDPTLEALSREHASVVTEAAEVLARYGEQHPEHRAAVAHVQQVEQLMAAEVRRSIEAERSEVNTLRRQEERLVDELSQVKLELLEKQRLQEQYDELKTAHDRVRGVFDSLGERGSEVDLQAHTSLNDVRVVDWALPPSRPAKPDIPLNMVLALGVGVVGGLGLALLRHRLDETISSPEDAERDLGEPLLGAIPSLVAEAAEGSLALYSYHHPRSLVAEALRGIRAVLVTHLGRGRSRRLLVTSCVAGEGKTATATALAIAYAQLGERVLLIEADLRNPRLHEIFELPVEPGLPDAMQPDQDPARFALATTIDNLFVLPAGARVQFPNELLASPDMGRTLDRLSDSFKMIIIDTPPAALVSDAKALAGDVDGIVLVVRRGVVPRRVAVETLGSLHQVGARVLGVVLNDVPPGRNTRYYDRADREMAGSDGRSAAS